MNGTVGSYLGICHFIDPGGRSRACKVSNTTQGMEHRRHQIVQQILEYDWPDQLKGQTAMLLSDDVVRRLSTLDGGVLQAALMHAYRQSQSK